MGIEQRVRAYKRSARNSFYSWKSEYGIPANSKVTNWRMILAMRFKMPIREIKRILGEMGE